METVRDSIENMEECDIQTVETDTVHLRMKAERPAGGRSLFHIPEPASWQSPRPTTRSISKTIELEQYIAACPVSQVTRVSIMVVIVRISRH